MTTDGEVLAPLPYEDVPSSKSPLDAAHSARTPDDLTPTRELSPDSGPSDSAGGTPPLLGSPMIRARYPMPSGERGLYVDDSRPPDSVDDEGRSKDLPDVLIPTLPARPEPKPALIDDHAATRIGEVVTKEELAVLKQRISELYERVTTELAPNTAKAALALGWLSEARTIGLGRPEQYPVAELRVAQTSTLLNQYKVSHEAGSRNARGLVIANVIWLVLFGALFFLDLWVQAGGMGAGTRAISALFPPWLCVLAGGIGGAMAALVALGRVVSQREYNPGNDLDYQLNALKGAILGGVAFYLILGGFVTAAATSGVALVQSADGSLMDQIQTGAAVSPLYIVLAFIAGLAQQRLLALLGRIWSQRTGESEPPASAIYSDLATVPVPVADVPVATSDGEPNQEETLPPVSEALPPTAGLG